MTATPTDRRNADRRDPTRDQGGRRLFDRIRQIDPFFTVERLTADERDAVIETLRARLAERGVKS